MQRGNRPVTLADAGDHRFAGIPRLFAVGGLPLARGQDAVGFADQVDAGLAAETEAAHPLAQPVDAHVQRELVEIGVGRLLDRRDHVHRAVAAALVVAVAARLPRQAELAVGEHRVRGLAQAEFQPAECQERLHRRPGRIHAAQGAVVQRFVRVGGQRAVVGLADTVDEQVGIERGHADHRQHLAVARIDRHCRTGTPFECRLGRLLDARVDAQVEAAAGRGRMGFQHVLGAAVGVDLQQFIAGLAVQQILVGTLHAAAPDMAGALVAIRVQTLQVVGVDAPHIADHVGEQGAERIMPGQVRHHVDVGKAPAIDRETVDLVLGQVHLQRHAVEATALPQLLVERVDVVLVQRHHLAQSRQQAGHVLDLFGHHLQPERRHVVGQHHAVAVVDQPACRRDRARLDPVVGRAGGELVVPGDLQHHVTPDQPAQPQQDQHETHQRAAAEQRGLVTDVLERAATLHLTGSCFIGSAAARAGRRAAGTGTATAPRRRRGKSTSSPVAARRRPGCAPAATGCGR